MIQKRKLEINQLINLICHTRRKKLGFFWIQILCHNPRQAEGKNDNN